MNYILISTSFATTLTRTHILRLMSVNQFSFNQTPFRDHIKRGCFYPGHNIYQSAMSIKETNLILAFTSFRQFDH